MWWRNVFLALIGISAGMVVAGGVFSFIVELGVISDFAEFRQWRFEGKEIKF